MKKQTAVEWLMEQLEEKGDIRETPAIRIVQLNIDTSDYFDLKRQAKSIEKEQITDAYMMGSYDMIEKVFKPEQYYNETFNQ